MRTYKPIPCRECGVTIVPTGPMVKWCESCIKVRNEERYKRDRRKKVLKKYGLTPEKYDEMLEAQGGGCAICHEPPGDRNLYVDHDHGCCPGQYTCGKCVRGLLCILCNTAYEQFNKFSQGFNDYQRAVYYDKSAEDGLPF